MSTNTPEVHTYDLQRPDGSHIRKATLVVLEDGEVIRFIDRLSKREAIRQARADVERRRCTFCRALTSGGLTTSVQSGRVERLCADCAPFFEYRPTEAERRMFGDA
jgi:hypothetical protein